MEHGPVSLSAACVQRPACLQRGSLSTSCAQKPACMPLVRNGRLSAALCRPGRALAGRQMQGRRRMSGPHVGHRLDVRMQAGGLVELSIHRGVGGLDEKMQPLSLSHKAACEKRLSLAPACTHILSLAPNLIYLPIESIDICLIFVVLMAGQPVRGDGGDAASPMCP